VRGGRPKPGLQWQHCTGVDLVGRLCGATVSGCTKDSTQLEFLPGHLKAPESQPVVADIETAGAIMLLQQISLPVALFAPCPLTLELRGGTNATKAPQVDYAQHVFLPMLRLFGAEAQLDIVRRGFFPKGQGVAMLQVQPVEVLRPITLVDRGVLKRIEIATYSAGRFGGYASALGDLVEASLSRWPESSVVIEQIIQEETRKTAFGDGFGVVIVAHTSTGCRLAGSAIGEQRKSTVESVAAEAVEELRGYLDQGGCVDEYLQDQLIIYMALAEGTSTIKTGPLSLHTQTAIHFAQVMCGAKFSTSPDPPHTTDSPGHGGTVTVECEGIGHRRGA